MNRTSLAIALAFALAAPVIHAQTLNDIGSSAPTPGADDVYMTDESAIGEVPGLNYYSNGSGAGGNPGEIFTTGSNPAGYTLTSLAVLTAGNGGDNISTIAQSWYLRLYSYNAATTNASLITTYTSQPFTFTETDWIQFTNLGAGLQPNSTYIYTIQNGGSGWELIAGEDTGNTTVNQAVLVSSAGGQLTLANNFSSQAPSWQADFDVGLSPVTGLVVNAPVVVTPGNIYPTGGVSAFATGTSVTLDCGAVLGAGPLTFNWQTDGGTGGALTNIPGATTSNYVFAVALAPGTFKYNVVVSNSSTSVTSTDVGLQVAFPDQEASLTDEGTNYISSIYYPSISQVHGGGTGDGLNYYDNNPAHPGQTFTTGTNSQGYVLTSVQIQTDPNSNEAGDSSDQPYDLFIYSVNTTTKVAQIIQAYTNASFTFNLGDWLAWDNLSNYLAPNSVYAYSFANNLSYNYAGLATSATNDYTGGQLCQIDPVSGGIIFDGTDPSTNNSAVFYLQLSAVGQPVPEATASPIAAAPTSGAPGTQFTLTEVASGASPLSYFWFTDNGTGGALASIPGNNSSNLVLNTTGWNPGIYSYEVIVSNSLNTATSAVVSVPVIYTTVSSNTAVLTDIGATTPTPGSDDIYQTNGVVGYQSTEPSGLNYYIDNSVPPGETFTTGGNPNGYVLTTAAVQLGDDDAYAGWPAGGQPYFLNIYNVYNDEGGQYAQLFEKYTSQTNFVLTVGVNEGDWLQFTGLNTKLQPNTKYAYAFGKVPGDAGYINLVADQNTPAFYTGGQAALLPGIGGQVDFPKTAGWNGTFDLGLNFGSTPITLSIASSGPNQLTLQWTGGILLQAPSVTGPWTTNSATSPYTVAPTGAQQFYQVQQQ